VIFFLFIGQLIDCLEFLSSFRMRYESEFV